MISKTVRLNACLYKLIKALHFVHGFLYTQKKRPRGRFCNIPNISSPHTPSSAFAKPK